MTKPTLNEFMATRPEGTLEKIAQDYQVSLLEVIKASSEHHLISGRYFEHIWNEVINWGKITILVNTPDIIFEFAGNLPTASSRHGYYNMQGKEGFSGHIKSDNCQYIAFVERKFMGSDTAGIIFINGSGEAMFKIFVGRDEQRNLVQSQLSAFRKLEQIKEES